MTYGIRLATSAYNNISDNTFINCGMFLPWYYSWYINYMKNNTVNGKPLVYLYGVSDYEVADAGQVILVSCFNITVKNLDLASYATVGIELVKTQNSTIINNNIANQRVGIYLCHSSNNTVSENKIENCVSAGIEVWHGKIYYWSLHPSRSNNVISRNRVTNCSGGGIYLKYSTDDIIDGNSILNCATGIGISRSPRAIVTNNYVEQNQIGIYIGSSSFSKVTGNNIRDNSYGIDISDSSGSSIFHNNFINNTVQVYMPWGGTHIWDNGYPSGGNYWSDYTDVDINSGPYQNETGSDGIWDHPYVIDENNQDRYPLVNPWTPTPPIQIWLFDSDFQYNLDDDYATVEGTGHLRGKAALSAGSLSIEGQITLNGPLPSAVPEVYLIATDGSDEELARQAVDLSGFSYWQTGPNTYNFTGQIPNVIQPINNGHFEVQALIIYDTAKYDFFVNTDSRINSHYFPLTTFPAPPTIPQPVNLEPPDGALDVDVRPQLVASPPLQDVPDKMIPWKFVEYVGYITEVYVQWQVTNVKGDYSSPVYDYTGRVYITKGWPRPEVCSTFVLKKLEYGTTYYWRVRYKDFRGIWSPWSKETSFTTIPWVLESDLTRDMRFTVDRTKKLLDMILEEARMSAKDGDYFAKKFKAEQIDLMVDSIFDALGTLSAAVPSGEDVIDLWKVSLSGGPDTPYAHILWFKHAYHDALFSSGETYATTMDILRWALTYYAADITGEAPDQISIEGLKLALKELLKSSLALQQRFVPSLERFVENLKNDLDNTLSNVLAEIRDLTPEEVEAYMQDLRARRQANTVLLNNLRTLALPLHIARQNWDQPGWKAKITEFFIRNLLKVLIGLVADGPGVVIYSLAQLSWDAFENLAELSEAAKMMDLAVAVVGNAFDASKRIFLNTIRGLENIKHRVAPQVGRGEIISIDNVVIAEFKRWFGRWDLFVKEAYSDVTISNSGSANTIYELTATYEKWGILGTSYTPLISQKALRIRAGRTNILRIYYYEKGRYGELPSKGTEIRFTLLGTTETGTYYIAKATTTFGTTIIANKDGLAISQKEVEEAQLIPYPIRSFVENSLNSTAYFLKILVENPLNLTISGNITQSLPDGVTVIDAGGGTIEGNMVSWQLNLEPGEIRQLNITFICQAPPGTIVEIPGATLDIYDPFQDDVVTFEADLSSLEAKFPIIARAHPPTHVSKGEEIKIPTNITNLNQKTFEGNITFEISDFEGNILYDLTYELQLAPKETRQIEITATPNIAPGIYVIRGILKKGEAKTNIFAEYISIDASSVMGIALLTGRNNHAGSIVKLGNFTTITNPDGSYLFLGVPAGNYLLIITHKSYATLLQEVTVSPYGLTILPQFSLTQIGVPPITRLEIHHPKFVIDHLIYITSATPLELTAEDNPGGSGVNTTSYRIYNATYDSGWITYTQPFYLMGLSDGTYQIDYNSTDYAGNVELTNTATIILFSWQYIYEDAQRGTTLKINTDHKLFQFITADKDFGIRQATTMYESYVTVYCNGEYVSLPAVIIRHNDSELRLLAYAGTEVPFCYARALDYENGNRYMLRADPAQSG